MPSEFSHFRSDGAVQMVDVSAKALTRREARARGMVAMKPAVLAGLAQNPKGDPLEVARIAGIMAAKRTAELIPLCHPLPLTGIDVEAKQVRGGIQLTATVSTTAPTGVEMEAMTAVSVAALTIYDMCKALDKGIEIREIVLLQKSGGKSGDFRRKAAKPRRKAVQA